MDPEIKPNQKLAPRRPVLLVILDGFGASPYLENNAVLQARTPRFDELFTHHPLTVLNASGKSVGLPEGQMGNSEVGHLTIGCGQIIRQDLVSIDDSIQDGSFFENSTLLEAIEKSRQSAKPLHLVGLVSDGGVHSHIGHLFALIELCKRQGVSPHLHMITDGRDTPPKSAKLFLAELEDRLHDANGRIASVMGRYYAMDRDRHWDRIEQAWQAIANSQGQHAENALSAIDQAYQQEITDEFIVPTVIGEASPLDSSSNMMFFNFRKDRARQLTAALAMEKFEDFDRKDYLPIHLTCMTEYDEWFHLPYAYCQDRPETTLGEIISQQGLKQFHCAETEKYAHVTYFFNGRLGEAYPNEDRVIVPSPRVATYDLAPAMSAKEVSDEVIRALNSSEYAFIVVNYANGDMVGHTGKKDAIIASIEALDREVGRVLDVAKDKQFSVILTADHGNCEEMVDRKTGAPHTQHTIYPVPCMIIDKENWQLSANAGLSAIAPTVLQLMGLEQPTTMTSTSLLTSKVAKAS